MTNTTSDELTLLEELAKYRLMEHTRKVYKREYMKTYARKTNYKHNKEYYQRNKAKRQEYQRKYYEKNKEAIQLKAKEARRKRRELARGTPPKSDE